jgi:hypothetical protein
VPRTVSSATEIVNGNRVPGLRTRPMLD